MKLNTVGIALSYYREKYGLSMTQVCEGICSPATMFRIEEGYRESICRELSVVKML